jgi:hypothetical protein
LELPTAQRSPALATSVSSSLGPVAGYIIIKLLTSTYTPPLTFELVDGRISSSWQNQSLPPNLLPLLGWPELQLQ